MRTMKKRKVELFIRIDRYELNRETVNLQTFFFLEILVDSINVPAKNNFHIPD